jgi:hypothetical protein
MKNKLTKILIFFIGVVVCGGCTKKKSDPPTDTKKIYQIWYNTDFLDRTHPQEIEFKPENKLFFRYKNANPQKGTWQDNHLFLTFQEQKTRYSWKLSNSDTLFLIPEKGEKLVYLPKNLLIKKDTLKDSNEEQQGKEKTIYDVLDALQATTVEARLNNLINEFAEGDYITTETICYLIGISPHPSLLDTHETIAHRNFVHLIKRITRKNERFEVELLNGALIDEDLPYYAGYGANRTKQGSFTVKIENGAYAKIETINEGKKINFSGIKLGKSWLKIGIPNMTISGDIANILGIKLNVAR